MLEYALSFLGVLYSVHINTMVNPRGSCIKTWDTQIFLKIFNETTPLSKYLQTVNADMLSACVMISTTMNTVKISSMRFKRGKNSEKNLIRPKLGCNLSETC